MNLILLYFYTNCKLNFSRNEMDKSKTKIGYEIPFTRYFYEYSPPRALSEIKSEIENLETEILGMLEEVLV